MGQTIMSGQEHLSADEVAAMVDGRMPADRRHDIEAHLAGCATCREELVAASRLVAASSRFASRPGRRFVLPGGVVAALAAAAVIAVVIPRVTGRQGIRPRVQGQRATAATSAATLRALMPLPAASMPRDSLRFVWQRDDDAMYRLFIVDSSGAQVFSSTTHDTATVIPRTVTLRNGERYFWYVDALRSDGSSVSSPAIDFVVAR